MAAASSSCAVGSITSNAGRLFCSLLVKAVQQVNLMTFRMEACQFVEGLL